tara:strand:+ start:255 stop:428 length:174 start_codon:yes stop_codon:yes gene_type:complete
MKKLIRTIIGRYIKLNPSLSDKEFVEVLSTEIADEIELAMKKRKEEKIKENYEQEKT